MTVMPQRKKLFRRFAAISAAAMIATLSSGSLSAGQSNSVYVLLYNPGTNNEGIHTVKMGTVNTVLIFKSQGDANRYATQLEAQEFPRPSVETINLEEILSFCRLEHHICQLIPAGVTTIPPTDNVPPSQRDFQLSPKPSFP